MNPDSKKHCYILFITDGINDIHHEQQLKHITDVISPDIIITDKPVKNITTFNFFSEKSINLDSDIVINNIHHDIDKNKKNIIIANDITHNNFTTFSPLLICGLGQRYNNYCNTYRQWFGRFNNLPWIIQGGQQTDHLSFVIIYIHKKTKQLQSGLHSFEWMFFSKNPYKKPDNMIFSETPEYWID